MLKTKKIHTLCINIEVKKSELEKCFVLVLTFKHGMLYVNSSNIYEDLALFLSQ